MGLKWKRLPKDALEDMLYRYTQFTMQATVGVANGRAEEATAWMKENAPWKDQTGQARESLVCKVYESSTNKLLREGREYTAKLQDEKQLSTLNKQRVSKGRKPLESLPKSRSAFEALKSDRDPLIRLEFTYDPNYKYYSRGRRIVEKVKKGTGVGRKKDEKIHYTKPVKQYAVWLEVAKGGKYSILVPAMDYWGRRLMKDIQRIANLGRITLGEVTPRKR